ncbi:MAG TPA: hypothetical protein VFL17_03555, partial [Anaerolineae bacterium]|nr:hypothetical protein [Anaerolineae bacterium]
EDFDIIVICISEPIDTVVTEDLMNRFRSVIEVAEKKRSSPIPIVGMNLYLSGRKRQAQANVFKGLFIGGDSSDEHIREMLTNLTYKQTGP